MSQHILIYTDDPGVGGVAQYNHAIAMALSQRGDRVTVVQTQQATPLVKMQQAAGIHHEWLPFDTMADFHRTFAEPRDAQIIFQRCQPDLILFSDSCPPANFAAKQSAIAAGIPFIVVIGFVAPQLSHHFAATIDPAPILAQLATYYDRAKAVIAVSQDNLTLLRTLFRLPPHQGQVIYYGRPDRYFAPRSPANRDRLRATLQIPEDGLLCFTPARLEPIKGYQYQLEMLLQLRQEAVWNQLHFAWAGTGSLQTWLETAIQQEGWGDRVHLLGQRWDIAEWLDAADLFLLPTEVEGMPLAIMEAMAKGLPVVASAVSGIPEELGDTGVLLPDPTQDSDATIALLTDTVRSLAVSPAHRESLGRAAQTRAHELFQETRMIRETLNVIARSLLPAGDYVSPGLAIVRQALDPQLPRLGPDSLNWVIFPDWHQPEAALLDDLVALLQFAITHPDRDRLSLLLVSDLNSEETELALAAASLHLFETEICEFDDYEPAIAFTPALTVPQWQALFPLLAGHLCLAHEDQAAVAPFASAIAQPNSADPDLQVVHLRH